MAELVDKYRAATSSFKSKQERHQFLAYQKKLSEAQSKRSNVEIAKAAERLATYCFSECQNYELALDNFRIAFETAREAKLDPTFQLQNVRFIGICLEQLDRGQEALTVLESEALPLANRCISNVSAAQDAREQVQQEQSTIHYNGKYMLDLLRIFQCIGSVYITQSASEETEDDEACAVNALGAIQQALLIAKKLRSLPTALKQELVRVSELDPTLPESSPAFAITMQDATALAFAQLELLRGQALLVLQHAPGVAECTNGYLLNSSLEWLQRKTLAWSYQNSTKSRSRSLPKIEAHHEASRLVYDVTLALRAQGFLMQKMFSEARLASQLALELDRARGVHDDAAALTTLAQVYVTQSQFTQAADCLEQRARVIKRASPSGDEDFLVLDLKESAHKLRLMSSSTPVIIAKANSLRQAFKDKTISFEKKIELIQEVGETAHSLNSAVLDLLMLQYMRKSSEMQAAIMELYTDTIFPSALQNHNSKNDMIEKDEHHFGFSSNDMDATKIVTAVESILLCVKKERDLILSDLSKDTQCQFTFNQLLRCQNADLSLLLLLHVRLADFVNHTDQQAESTNEEDENDNENRENDAKSSEMSEQGAKIFKEMTLSQVLAETWADGHEPMSAQILEELLGFLACIALAIRGKLLFILGTSLALDRSRFTIALGSLEWALMSYDQACLYRSRHLGAVPDIVWDRILTEDIAKARGSTLQELHWLLTRSVFYYGPHVTTLCPWIANPGCKPILWYLQLNDSITEDNQISEGEKLHLEEALKSFPELLKKRQTLEQVLKSNPLHNALNEFAPKDLSSEFCAYRDRFLRTRGLSEFVEHNTEKMHRNKTANYLSSSDSDSDSNSSSSTSSSSSGSNSGSESDSSESSSDSDSDSASNSPSPQIFQQQNESLNQLSADETLELSLYFKEDYQDDPNLVKIGAEDSSWMNISDKASATLSHAQWITDCFKELVLSLSLTPDEIDGLIKKVSVAPPSNRNKSECVLTEEDIASVEASNRTLKQYSFSVDDVGLLVKNFVDCILFPGKKPKATFSISAKKSRLVSAVHHRLGQQRFTAGSDCDDSEMSIFHARAAAAHFILELCLIAQPQYQALQDAMSLQTSAKSRVILPNAASASLLRLAQSLLQSHLYSPSLIVLHSLSRTASKSKDASYLQRANYVSAQAFVELSSDSAYWRRCFSHAQAIESELKSDEKINDLVEAFFLYHFTFDSTLKDKTTLQSELKVTSDKALSFVGYEEIDNMHQCLILLRSYSARISLYFSQRALDIAYNSLSQGLSKTVRQIMVVDSAVLCVDASAQVHSFKIENNLCERYDPKNVSDVIAHPIDNDLAMLLDWSEEKLTWPKIVEDDFLYVRKLAGQCVQRSLSVLFEFVLIDNGFAQRFHSFFSNLLNGYQRYTHFLGEILQSHEGNVNNTAPSFRISDLAVPMTCIVLCLPFDLAKSPKIAPESADEVRYRTAKYQQETGWAHVAEAAERARLSSFWAVSSLSKGLYAFARYLQLDSSWSVFPKWTECLRKFAPSKYFQIKKVFDDTNEFRSHLSRRLSDFSYRASATFDQLALSLVKDSHTELVEPLKVSLDMTRRARAADLISSLQFESAETVLVNLLSSRTSSLATEFDEDEQNFVDLPEIRQVVLGINAVQELRRCWTEILLSCSRLKTIGNTFEWFGGFDFEMPDSLRTGHNEFDPSKIVPGEFAEVLGEGLWDMFIARNVKLSNRLFKVNSQKPIRKCMYALSSYLRKRDATKYVLLLMDHALHYLSLATTCLGASALPIILPPPAYIKLIKRLSQTISSLKFCLILTTVVTKPILSRSLPATPVSITLDAASAALIQVCALTKLSEMPKYLRRLALRIMEMMQDELEWESDSVVLDAIRVYAVEAWQFVKKVDEGNVSTVPFLCNLETLDEDEARRILRKSIMVTFGSKEQIEEKKIETKVIPDKEEGSGSGSPELYSMDARDDSLPSIRLSVDNPDIPKCSNVDNFLPWSQKVLYGFLEEQQVGGNMKDILKQSNVGINQKRNKISDDSSNSDTDSSSDLDTEDSLMINRRRFKTLLDVDDGLSEHPEDGVSSIASIGFAPTSSEVVNEEGKGITNVHDPATFWHAYGISEDKLPISGSSEESLMNKTSLEGLLAELRLVADEAIATDYAQNESESTYEYHESDEDFNLIEVDGDSSGSDEKPNEAQPNRPWNANSLERKTTWKRSKSKTSEESSGLSGKSAKQIGDSKNQVSPMEKRISNRLPFSEDAFMSDRYGSGTLRTKRPFSVKNRIMALSKTSFDEVSRTKTLVRSSQKVSSKPKTVFIDGNFFHDMSTPAFRTQGLSVRRHEKTSPTNSNVQGSVESTTSAREDRNPTAVSAHQENIGDTLSPDYSDFSDDDLFEQKMRVKRKIGKNEEVVQDIRPYAVTNDDEDLSHPHETFTELESGTDVIVCSLDSGPPLVQRVVSFQLGTKVTALEFLNQVERVLCLKDKFDGRLLSIDLECQGGGGIVRLVGIGALLERHPHSKLWALLGGRLADTWRIDRLAMTENEGGQKLESLIRAIAIGVTRLLRMGVHQPQAASSFSLKMHAYVNVIHPNSRASELQYDIAFKERIRKTLDILNSEYSNVNEFCRNSLIGWCSALLDNSYQHSQPWARSQLLCCEIVKRVCNRDEYKLIDKVREQLPTSAMMPFILAQECIDASLQSGKMSDSTGLVKLQADLVWVLSNAFSLFNPPSFTYNPQPPISALWGDKGVLMESAPFRGWLAGIDPSLFLFTVNRIHGDAILYNLNGICPLFEPYGGVGSLLTLTLSNILRVRQVNVPYVHPHSLRLHGEHVYYVEITNEGKHAEMIEKYREFQKAVTTTDHMFEMNISLSRCALNCSDPRLCMLILLFSTRATCIGKCSQLTIDLSDNASLLKNRNELGSKGSQVEVSNDFIVLLLFVLAISSAKDSTEAFSILIDLRGCGIAYSEMKDRLKGTKWADLETLKRSFSSFFRNGRPRATNEYIEEEWWKKYFDFRKKQMQEQLDPWNAIMDDLLELTQGLNVSIESVKSSALVVVVDSDSDIDISSSDAAHIM